MGRVCEQGENIYWTKYEPDYMLDILYASSHLISIPIMKDVIIIFILCMRKLRLQEVKTFVKPSRVVTNRI